MKHYIICKFIKGYDWRSNLNDIQKLFNQALEFEGVEKVILKDSNSKRENRFDLMIEMILSQKGLEIYDVSKMHQDWKSIYGKYIESKTIFDCEE